MNQQLIAATERIRTTVRRWSVQGRRSRLLPVAAPRSGQPNDELAALSQTRARCRDAAPMTIDEIAYQGQSDPEPGIAVAGRRIRLHEQIEYAR